MALEAPRDIMERVPSRTTWVSISSCILVVTLRMRTKDLLLEALVQVVSEQAALAVLDWQTEEAMALEVLGVLCSVVPLEVLAVLVPLVLVV